MNDDHEKRPVHTVVHTDTPPSAETAAPPQPEAKRGKGGAPRGNVNAARDKAFAQFMKRMQADGRRRNDRFFRTAVAQQEAVLASLGMSDDAIAIDMVRVRVNIQAEAERLRDFVDKRGRTDAKGNLKPAYEALLRIQREELPEARRLLELALDRRGSGDIGRPIGGITVLEPIIAPQIGLAAIDAPLDDAGPPAPTVEPVARPDRATPAREPVQSETPAATPEPAKRQAPGTSLVPGPRRSLDELLVDAGLSPRKPTGEFPTW
jgi:hypothetical protein